MWLSSVKPRIPGTRIYFTLALLLICYGTGTESLMCFQCEATSIHGDCIANWMTMANATTRHLYAKNCTASNANWTRCAIQRAELKGDVQFFLRGCHDGIHFAPALYSPRFKGLPPDNQTTCDNVGVTWTAVCYTSCDTDFCNGPQLIPETNCTDTDSDSCRAPGIFGKTQLVSTEVLCLITSLLLIRWLVQGPRH